MKLNQLFYVILFLGLALLSYQVNIFKMWGEEGTFTAYNFLAALPATYLGGIPGTITILGSGIINKVLNGEDILDLNLFAIARLATMPLASLYFLTYKNRTQKNKLFGVGVAVLCMLLFVIHPVGVQAWQYSLFWLIPIIALLIPDNLLVRSLGTTFTAHAVGSVAFLYFMQSTPALWLTLLPIVVLERLTFGAGISVTHILLTNFMTALFPKGTEHINIEYAYALWKNKNIKYTINKLQSKQ